MKIKIYINLNIYTYININSDLNMQKYYHKTYILLNLFKPNNLVLKFFENIKKIRKKKTIKQAMP